jgi:Arc/MetJ family transcription regulator
METRTNIVLDDELVAKAMVKARVTTKKAAIDTALRAYVRGPDWQGLLALAGSGVLADDYDPANLFADVPEHPTVALPTTARRTQRRTALESIGAATRPVVATRRK